MIGTGVGIWAALRGGGGGGSLSGSFAAVSDEGSLIAPVAIKGGQVDVGTIVSSGLDTVVIAGSFILPYLPNPQFKVVNAHTYTSIGIDSLGAVTGQVRGASYNSGSETHSVSVESGSRIDFLIVSDPDGTSLMSIAVDGEVEHLHDFVDSSSETETRYNRAGVTFPSTYNQGVPPFDILAYWIGVNTNVLGANATDTWGKFFDADGAIFGETVDGQTASSFMAPADSPAVVNLQSNTADFSLSRRIYPEGSRLMMGGSVHIPRWVTAWTWLYNLTESDADTLAAAIAGHGYTGVEINIIEGAASATNRNGESALSGTAINTDFLDDSIPLIDAIVDNDLTVILNLAWGSHFATGASALMDATEAATFGDAIAGWWKANWPGNRNLVISLIADYHPDSAGAQIIEAMGDAVAAVLPGVIITTHPAVPVASGSNWDGSDISKQSALDYGWTSGTPDWLTMIMLQSGHAALRPRASAPQQMYRRSYGNSLPFIDMEAGYNEIPAGLPADVLNVDLADDPVTTYDGLDEFDIEFDSAHGLTTATDDGRDHWVYPVSVSTTGGLSFSGVNCLVTDVVDTTTLTVQHPTQIATSSTTGGGTAGQARLRSEYFTSERLSPHHVRQKVFQQMVAGAAGTCESAEGLYNLYSDVTQGNFKYLPQEDYLDALSGVADAWPKSVLNAFAARRLEPEIASTSSDSFVRIYGSTTQFYLGSTGSRQNLGRNVVAGAATSVGDFALVYSVTGQSFSLNLAEHLTDGFTYNAEWINPSTGLVYSSSAVPVTSESTAVIFTPPSSDVGVPLSGVETDRQSSQTDWLLSLSR